MGFLQQILGGGQQEEVQDFVNRYNQGAPYEGISNEEAVNRYQQVAPQLPPDTYQQAAQDAFSRMSPQERTQLGQYLVQSAQQQGINVPGMSQGGMGAQGGLGGMLQDAGFLSQLVGGMQQQPGIVGQLLGGVLGGGMMGGGSQMGGGAGNMLDNPVAKAALAGIAAMAAQRVMGQR